MERLNAVLPYIKQNKCALFIGAGLSKIAGCDVWKSLVEKMFDNLIFQERRIKKEDLIEKLGNERLMGYCRKVFEEDGKMKEYWGIVRDAIMFQPELHQKAYLPLIKLLKSINPLPHIITTNIDNCLASTREFSLSNIFYKTEDFKSTNLDSPSIIHIHGYHEDLENCLLTRDQYISRYEEPDFRVFLKYIFNTYAVIFIGYGFGDTDIQDIMLKTNTDSKNHFLLVPEEDNLPASYLSLLHDLYGIVTIIYGKRDNLAHALGSWITKNFKPVQLGVGDIGGLNVED